jgi:hypothetical protein
MCFNSLISNYLFLVDNSEVPALDMPTTISSNFT